MKNVVLRTVANLATLYSAAGYGPEGVRAVADTWTQILIEERVSVDHFRLAVNRMIKTRKFFPTIAEILEEVRAIRIREYNERQPQLPAVHGDQRQENIETINRIRDMLSRGMSFDKVADKLEKCQRITTRTTAGKWHGYGS